MRSSLTALLSLLCLSACVGAPALVTSRLVDLTHAAGQDTVTWPGSQAFERQGQSGEDEQGRWYALGSIRCSEHSGTHLDAPLHFGRDGRSVDQIPLTDLIGPVRVIDVRAACEADRDYAVAVEDITAHEAAEGRIGIGSVVILRTGWESRWNDSARYLGGSTAETLHFPGLSLEGARLLADRRVALVGIDTASLDPGVAQAFPAHRILAAAQVAGLENLTGLDALPVRGATLIALPLKLAGGSGAPARVVALLP